MKESRQIRRARQRSSAKQETRRQRFDRLHGQVLAARTIRDFWTLYAKARFEGTGVDITSDAMKHTVEHAFYAGVGSALDLMLRVAPDDVSEEVGMEMLTRLHEELDTYNKQRY